MGLNRKNCIPFDEFVKAIKEHRYNDVEEASDDT